MAGLTQLPSSWFHTEDCAAYVSDDQDAECEPTRGVWNQLDGGWVGRAEALLTADAPLCQIRALAWDLCQKFQREESNVNQLMVTTMEQCMGMMGDCKLALKDDTLPTEDRMQAELVVGCFTEMFNEFTNRWPAMKEIIGDL